MQILWLQHHFITDKRKNVAKVFSFQRLNWRWSQLLITFTWKSMQIKEKIVKRYEFITFILSALTKKNLCVTQNMHFLEILWSLYSICLYLLHNIKIFHFSRKQETTSKMQPILWPPINVSVSLKSSLR